MFNVRRIQLSTFSFVVPPFHTVGLHCGHLGVFETDKSNTKKDVANADRLVRFDR
jgi:hypothetical protein